MCLESKDIKIIRFPRFFLLHDSAPRQRLNASETHAGRIRASAKPHDKAAARGT